MKRIGFLSSPSSSSCSRTFFHRSIPVTRMFLYFSQAFGWPFSLEWLELARRRVSDDDALEDRLLDDPVRDGVLEIVPNDGVSEEIEGLEREGGAIARFGLLSRRAGLRRTAWPRGRLEARHGPPPSQLPFSLRSERIHAIASTSGSASSGVSLARSRARCSNCAWAGSSPDVVRLVVQDEQAVRAREALEKRRLDRFEPGRIVVVEEHLHLPFRRREVPKIGQLVRVRRNWW